MRSWIVVIVFAALVALGCGDDLIPDTADPRSGARLKLQWFEYDDGARQLADGLFDSVRGEVCRPLQWSDGFTYCTPATHATAYTDVDCTVEVGRVGPADAPASYFQHVFVVGRRALPSKLFAVGEPVAEPAAVFEQRAADGACVPLFAPGSTYHALGAETTRGELAAITRAEVPTRGRLAVHVDKSADGLRVPAAIVDRELAAECVPLPAANRATTVCGPRDAQPAVYFHDAACTQPELAVARVRPEHAVQHDGDGCPTYFDVGTEVGATPLYRLTPTCSEATTSGERLFLVGDQLDVATLARVRGDGGRIQPVVFGELGIAEPLVFDAMLGGDCTATTVADGARCMPAAVAPTLVLYRDELCLDAVVAAIVPTASCTPAPTHAVRDGAYHAIGAASAAVHEITTGDRCVPYIAVAGTAVHDVGPALPLAAFAPATLVVDP